MRLLRSLMPNTLLNVNLTSFIIVMLRTINRCLTALSFTLMTTRTAEMSFQQTKEYCVLEEMSLTIRNVRDIYTIISLQSFISIMAGIL